MAFRERATVGARGQPIVGEVLAALATPEGRADPYPLYERLRAIGPAATMNVSWTASAASAGSPSRL
ncbi:MAG TPA: hypothetical protein VF256_11265, partial [Streptosporangiaceae bacterium]